MQPGSFPLDAPQTSEILTSQIFPGSLSTTGLPPEQTEIHKPNNAPTSTFNAHEVTPRDRVPKDNGPSSTPLDKTVTELDHKALKEINRGTVKKHVEDYQKKLKEGEKSLEIFRNPGKAVVSSSKWTKGDSSPTAPSTAPLPRKFSLISRQRSSTSVSSTYNEELAKEGCTSSPPDPSSNKVNNPPDKQKENIPETDQKDKAPDYSDKTQDEYMFGTPRPAQEEETVQEKKSPEQQKAETLKEAIMDSGLFSERSTPEQPSIVAQSFKVNALLDKVLSPFRKRRNTAALPLPPAPNVLSADRDAINERVRSSSLIPPNVQLSTSPPATTFSQSTVSATTQPFVSFQSLQALQKENKLGFLTINEVSITEKSIITDSSISISDLNRILLLDESKLTDGERVVKELFIQNFSLVPNKFRGQLLTELIKVADKNEKHVNAALTVIDKLIDYHKITIKDTAGNDHCTMILEKSEFNSALKKIKGEQAEGIRSKLENILDLEEVSPKSSETAVPVQPKNDKTKESVAPKTFEEETSKAIKKILNQGSVDNLYQLFHHESVTGYTNLTSQEINSLSYHAKILRMDPKSNIPQIAKKFNCISGSIANAILAAKTVKEAQERKKSFMKVAIKAFENNDMNTAFAVVSAIENSSIDRINVSENKQYKEVANIFSPRLNFTTYRDYEKQLREKNKKIIPIANLPFKDLEPFKEYPPKVEDGMLNIGKLFHAAQMKEPLRAVGREKTSPPKNVKDFFEKATLLASNDEERYEQSKKLKPPKFQPPGE